MQNTSEKIIYGIHATPFGDIVVAITDKGLCWLGYMVKGYKGDGLTRMKEHFPSAEFVRDDNATKDMTSRIQKSWEQGKEKDIPLDLRGTDFQKSVWNALLEIPKGKVWSYGDLAVRIGRPKASRAVGTAVGENPVSLIVPCHRIVQKSGAIGNYGWGPDLKEKLLKAEGAIG